MLRKWNVPKFKEVSMSKVRDIQWNSSDVLEPSTVPQDNEPTFRTLCESLTPFKDEKVTNFLDLIHSDGQESALRTLMYPEELKRSTSLRDEIFLCSLYSPNNKNKSIMELIQIGRDNYLKLTNDELLQISSLTKRKSKLNCWLALRRGRITGCIFKDTCVANITNPSITTINRVINPIKNMDQIPSVK